MSCTKGEYIRYTKRFIEQLCKGDIKTLEKCGTQVQWVFPLHSVFSDALNIKLKEAVDYLASGVKEVTHQDYYVIMLSGGNVVVSGSFLTHVKHENNLYQEQCYCTHIFYQANKIVYLEIEQRKCTGKRLELHNLERESRFVWEDEIIYVEAMRDHLYWNCRLGVIETTGTLMELEKKLSDFFVRIHRSYIVNKNHISKIHKCEVGMDNGDLLQIPPKKYFEIKRKLQSSSPDQ